MNIKAYQLPSKRWRCQIYIGDTYENGKRKKQYKSFTEDTQHEAEIKGIQYLSEKKPLDYKKMTFNEAATSYIQQRSKILSPTTIQYYKSFTKDGNGLDRIRDLDLSEITQEMLQIVMNEYAINHKWKSCNNLHAFISTIFNIYNPNFRWRITMPKGEKVTRNIPTEDGIKKMIDYCHTHDDKKCMEVPIMLGAFCGMRRGEICGLKYEDIDYEHNIIHVHAVKVYANRKVIVKQPKTSDSDRFIEAPEFVIREIGKGKGFITDLTINSISTRFWHIWNACGLKHCRFHDLRHFYASSLHAINIPDAYIMLQGGWKSDGILKDVYRNVLDDKKEIFSTLSASHFEKIMSEKSELKTDTD